MHRGCVVVCREGLYMGCVCVRECVFIRDV